ncbi:13522_t:CDS:2, partial [Rhizophagus irregularis]
VVAVDQMSYRKHIIIDRLRLNFNYCKKVILIIVRIVSFMNEEDVNSAKDRPRFAFEIFGTCLERLRN